MVRCAVVPPHHRVMPHRTKVPVPVIPDMIPPGFPREWHGEYLSTEVPGLLLELLTATLCAGSHDGGTLRSG